MPGARVLGFLILAVAFVASATAEVHHLIPKDKLKRRLPFFHSSPPPPPFLPKLDSEQQEYVNAHNDLRRKVNTPPLTWSPNLTAEAQAWARKRRGDCNHRLHSRNRNGENIFFMEYKEFTPTEVVQRWFNESRFYDRKTNTCRCRPQVEGCECGHYLNVVWSKTRRVGCSGAVYCDGQKGIIVVCQYDPPGLEKNINPFTGIRL